MTIDNSVRWVRRVTLAVALIMIAWGSSVVLGQPVTACLPHRPRFGWRCC